MSSSKKRKRSKLLTSFFYSSFVLFILAWLSRSVLQLLFFTIKIEAKGTKKFSEHIKALNANKEISPIIIALWHNQLLLVPVLRRFAPIDEVSCIISKSRDGALLTRFAETFSAVGVIRVPHTNRHGALLQMIDALERKKVVLITPDGASRTSR